MRKHSKPAPQLLPILLNIFIAHNSGCYHRICPSQIQQKMNYISPHFLSKCHLPYVVYEIELVIIVLSIINPYV